MQHIQLKLPETMHQDCLRSCQEHCLGSREHHYSSLTFCHHPWTLHILPSHPSNLTSRTANSHDDNSGKIQLLQVARAYVFGHCRPSRWRDISFVCKNSLSGRDFLLFLVQWPPFYSSRCLQCWQNHWLPAESHLLAPQLFMSNVNHLRNKHHNPN